MLRIVVKFCLGDGFNIYNGLSSYCTSTQDLVAITSGCILGDGKYENVSIKYVKLTMNGRR